jgi:cyclic pyranopterin phosphate synthase
MPELTHFDDKGASRMVDVSSKETTLRVAVASGIVRMREQTLAMILDQKVAKGDVLGVARLAGIMAAKRTGDLIPLCHPIGLDSVELDLIPIDEKSIRISATVRVLGRTGVEMEAMTAVTVAGLTVYDMCKSVDREMVIDAVRLESKSGGKSGTFRRVES